MIFLMLAVLAGPPPAGPEVVAEWRFARGAQGWTAGNTKPLRVENGALVVDTEGRDPILVSPPLRVRPAVDDVLEVRLSSSQAGALQWFWRTSTTGPYGGFEPEVTVLAPLTKSAGMQTVRARPFWKAGAPIVGLRLDPPEGAPGVYRIESIRWLRPARRAPVAPRFVFPRDAAGWTDERVEPAKAAATGLALDAARPGARLAAPSLTARAKDLPYLTVELSAPLAADPDGRARIAVEYASRQGGGKGSAVLLVAPGRRGRYTLRMTDQPAWEGDIGYLAVGPARAGRGTLRLHALALGAAPPPASLADRPTGLEMQTAPWRTEARVPVAPRRIDIARDAPPATKAIPSDYTVAMWYFAAWEPEYDWDGWAQVAERSPWRIPLLYDSADPAMEHNGIRFYRSSNPRAVDWHVHWMREHAVNLMLWDWYPHVGPDGAFDPGFFGNRALEIGFLGKERVGGPPVATNRFAKTMPFAVMWTNHAPGNRIGRGLQEYIVDQFLRQPNYYRVDGRPLVAVWSVSDLVSGAGSEAGARAALDRLRDYARERGLPGVYIAAVNGLETQERARTLGFDGVMAYNYLLAGGWRAETRRVAGRAVEDRIEDFATQSIPGQQQTWERMARAFGRDYLLATTPMQNWEPTFRPFSYVIQHHTPDLYREMLRRARAFMDAKGLRRFVSVEAFNEWLEGSYVEPSTQWGLGYLEAIRDVFGQVGAALPASDGGKDRSGP